MENGEKEGRGEGGGVNDFKRAHVLTTTRDGDREKERERGWEVETAIRMANLFTSTAAAVSSCSDAASLAARSATSCCALLRRSPGAPSKKCKMAAAAADWTEVEMLRVSPADMAEREAEKAWGGRAKREERRMQNELERHDLRDMERMILLTRRRGR